MPQGSAWSDVADMRTPCMLYMPLETSMALSESMSEILVGSPPFSPRTKPAYTCLRYLLISQIPTGSPPRHPLFAGASVVHHWQIPIASDGSRFFYGLFHFLYYMYHWNIVLNIRYNNLCNTPTRIIIEVVINVAVYGDVMLSDISINKIDNTGISIIDVPENDTSVYYDIRGIKTSTSSKGVYIHNGRKYAK